MEGRQTIVFSDFEQSGPSGDVNFAVGGIVSPNVAIHATLAAWSVSDPDLEYAGVEGEGNYDLGLAMIGGGITCYFMPANAYLSGSFGAAQLSIDDEESDTGWALDVTAGKEWWVGNRWGLGIAAGVSIHEVPLDDAVDFHSKGSSFALRFSATMN